MQLHNIKRKTKNKKSVQVGRGGKRGKTSGRGTKGQRARSGRKLRPEMRDIIKKLPKLRGYDFNTIETKPLGITLSTIAKNTKADDVVTLDFLIAKKVIATYKGKTPKVKVLGNKKDTVIDHKITLEGIAVSAQVRAAVEKAGGLVR
jgi:large subunit ribosomal protein L15